MKIMEKEKVNLFDFLKSVSETKEELFDWETFEKDYPPFMINRFLAAAQDTIFYANTMSYLSHLPKKLQYAFLLYGIDKKKRYFQYTGKGEGSANDLKNTTKYYNCSKEQAMEYLELLTDEQIQNINNFFGKRIER